MKKRINKIVLLVLTFFLTICSFSAKPKAKTANTLRELRQELANLQAQKKSQENAKKSSNI